MAAFPRYEGYKESGVDWLGEIPSHWDLQPGMVCLKKKTEKNIGMIESTVLSLSYGKIVVKPEEKLTGLVPESFETYQIIDPNDIVIRPTDLQNDTTSLRTGISRHRGIITSAYICLQPTGDSNPDYLHYLLHAYDLLKVFYGMGSGLRQNLDYRDFKRMPIVLPSLPEQTRIAAFLDEKTAEIDGAIAKKRRLIELLQEQQAILISRAVTRGLDPDAPMRDCDVPGIDSIPSHWKVLPNRRLFRETSRKITSPDEMPLSLSQIDGVVPSSDMRERSLKPAHRDNFKLVLPDDLVVNRFKGHLGVFFSSAYRGIVTFHYGVFVPQIDINSKYYELLYHTAPYKNIYAGASNGMSIGLQNLSNQNFYDVRTIIPPKAEQDAIVDYVSEVLHQYAVLIETIETELEKLDEYRTILIAEAVTGKIKI